MDMEVQLFESIESVSTTFAHVIEDQINDFLRDAQAIFREIKELIDNFCEKSDIMQRMWKTQRAVVDDREFRLQKRAREWSRELLHRLKE